MAGRKREAGVDRGWRETVDGERKGVILDGRFACRDDMACQVTPFRSVDASAPVALTAERGWRDSESFRDRTG